MAANSQVYEVERVSWFVLLCVRWFAQSTSHGNSSEVLADIELNPSNRAPRFEAEDQRLV